MLRVRESHLPGKQSGRERGGGGPAERRGEEREKADVKRHRLKREREREKRVDRVKQ